MYLLASREQGGLIDIKNARNVEEVVAQSNEGAITRRGNHCWADGSNRCPLQMPIDGA